MSRSVLLLQNVDVGSGEFPSGDTISVEDSVADDLVLNGQAAEITVNGTGVIASGTTSVGITHGLGRTPSIVSLNGQHAETAALFSTAVTSSSFTVNVAFATTGNRSFYWDVA